MLFGAAGGLCTRPGYSARLLDLSAMIAPGRTPNPRAVHVPPRHGPLRIDGRLDEADWKAAEALDAVR